MIIFIPTRSRERQQITLGQLPRALKQQTILVTDHGKAKGLRLWYERSVKDIWELPPEVKGIAAVRAYIMTQSPEPQLCMLDDDLRFQWRRPDLRRTKATEEEILRGFALLREWLQEGLTHCSISHRAINWDCAEPWLENTRMMHVLAYNRDAVRAAGCAFNAEVGANFSMDDFHMTLQLLRKGHKNRVSLEFVSSPSTSNAAGGASDWRTLESHNASARRLQELHGPELVRVKQKHGWHGMEGDRYDVIVRWRKAFGHAI